MNKGKETKKCQDDLRNTYSTEELQTGLRAKERKERMEADSECPYVTFLRILSLFCMSDQI